MRAVLSVPLAPAAGAAVMAALAARASPALAAVVAAALALACALLAVASADRPRRLVWCAAALGAAIAGGSGLVSPLPVLDLRHAGPMDAIRDALAAPLARLLPEPESGIVRGIVLGERAGMDPDLSLAFARSGTAHLLAISGFNMTLVAAAVGTLLRGRVPATVNAAATACAVVLYSVLVGLGPSVLRAALMAVVAACGLAFGRRAATVNALAFAIAAMVALDPTAIGDVGFLLSAGATGGLLFLASPLARGLSWLPRAIGEGLATTLAATVPTLPIIAAVFGRVSLVSPIANLVAVPLFPPLMIAGAATAALGVVSVDAAQVPALAAYTLAAALRGIVESSAALPLASLAVPDGGPAGFVYAVVVALLLYAAPRGASRIVRTARARIVVKRVAITGWSLSPRVRTLVVVALAAALVVAGFTFVSSSANAPAVRLRALDVGQGDAYLVEIGARTLLIDGGPDPGRLLSELGASLPPWRRRLDVVALTHAHADHADGLIALLDRYEVGLALEPVGLNPGPVASAWNEHITRSRVTRRALAAGARIRIGDATLQVLGPDDDPRVDVPSFVLRLERPGFSALFMGDATEQAQADLLLRPEPLMSRVYVPPHHGAATAHATSLVEAVHPSVALISAGAGNRYGHPTAQALEALAAVPTYRTDRDGTVELDFDGNRLVVRTHANGLPPPRGGSVPRAAPPR